MSDDALWTWSLEETLPSKLGTGGSFLERVLDQLAQYEWSDTHIFAVRLSVDEALTNAIRHGNRLDERKQVSLGCKMSSDRIRVEIEDEGHGFDPGQVPDPTLPENLEKPTGRGLTLMRHYMTHVEFNRRGNRVIMEKMLESDPKS